MTGESPCSIQEMGIQIRKPVRETQQAEQEKKQSAQRKGWFARLFRKRKGLIKSISLCI